MDSQRRPHTARDLTIARSDFEELRAGPRSARELRNKLDAVFKRREYVGFSRILKNVSQQSNQDQRTSVKLTTPSSKTPVNPKQRRLISQFFPLTLCTPSQTSEKSEFFQLREEIVLQSIGNPHPRLDLHSLPRRGINISRSSRASSSRSSMDFTKPNLATAKYGESSNDGRSVQSSAVSLPSGRGLEEYTVQLQPADEEVAMKGTKEATKGMFHRMMFLHGQEDLSAQLTARRFWAGICATRPNNKCYFPSNEFERKQHEKKRVMEASCAAIELKHTRKIVEAEMRRKIPKTKQFLLYNLPDQSTLVAQDQCQNIAKEGTILLKLKERQERQRKAEFASLLESMKMEGEVAGDLKIQAQRAFLNGSVEDALQLLREAQSSFGTTKHQNLDSAGVQTKVDVPRTNLIDVAQDVSEQVERVKVQPRKSSEQRRSYSFRMEKTEEAKAAVEDESNNDPVTDRMLRNQRLRVVMIQQHLNQAIPSQVDLHNHKLQEIPLRVVEAADRLRTINLHHNLLTGLPEMFLNNAAQLTSLDLSFNKLQRLPPGIGNLRSLRIANLSHNHLVGLPSTTGCLLNLESLNVDANELSKFPPSMSNLKKLANISLEGNHPFSLPPQNIIEQGVVEILKYLETAFADGRAAMEKLWSELDRHTVDLTRLITIVVSHECEKAISSERFYEVLRWEHRIMVSRQEVQALFQMLDDDGDGIVEMRDFLYLRDNSKEQRRLEYAAKKVILRLKNVLMNKAFDIWRDEADFLRYRKQVVSKSLKRMRNLMSNRMLVVILAQWREILSDDNRFDSERIADLVKQLRPADVRRKASVSVEYT